MKSVRIGIVGLGFMAATHVKACRRVPGAIITALCNPSGRHLDGDFSKVAGNIGGNDPIKLDMNGVRAYRTVQDLLADPNVDAIDICSPTSSHPELLLAALQAGKHVLCEKPLARTSKEAKAMVAEADKARTFFMPAMCIRFWPEWAWVRQA
ncbi:MAG: Gfo/Idh/MocA family oxidoreductase, partial [Opitutaceae bacterium]|nr:Gfo/Idh/MocA family oxidoreductase [Verrucomicrobiales bacterium]